VVTVNLTPPEGSQGVRYLRLRVQAGSSDVAFSGSSGQPGEVEDHVLNVLECPVLNVSGPSPLPLGAVGVSYPPQTFTINGIAPDVWSLEPAIPGMTISQEGVLSGTPSQGGTFHATVRASDSTGCSGSMPITLVVQSCPPEQLFVAGQTYQLTVDAGIVSAMWYRDTGGGPVPINGANGLTYTVTQPGVYTWSGLDATGCLVHGCCSVGYGEKDYGDYLVSGPGGDAASASATIDARLRLGSNGTDADEPSISPPTSAANSDDNDGVDDEDSPMPAGVVAGSSASFNVNVLNTTSANAFLSVWVDFNNNNSLDDAGELVVSSFPVGPSPSAQPVSRTFSVPANAEPVTRPLGSLPSEQRDRCRCDRNWCQWRGGRLPDADSSPDQRLRRQRSVGLCQQHGQLGLIHGRERDGC